jgi:succinate-semialdehyde dehydrogenase/glutarate-semialdehyde dehydrogenase
MIRILNPATGEEVAAYPEHTAQHIEQALAAADTAQRSWRQTSLAHRRELMLRAATVLRTRRQEYARLMTAEMGKPLAEAEAEVDKCAWNCEFYAENAEGFLADEQIATSAEASFTTYEPLGVVLAVMPWNFPFWQVLRFAAPAPPTSRPLTRNGDAA